MWTMVLHDLLLLESRGKGSVGRRILEYDLSGGQ